MEFLKECYNQLESNNNYNNHNDCNCKSKGDCPMGGKCDLKNAIYQATIFPKENGKEKSLYWNFVGQIEGSL